MACLVIPITSKGKVHPRTGHDGPEGEYSSFFILGARCGWVVNATPRMLFPSGMTRYPLYRRLGGPRAWPVRVQIILFRSSDRPSSSELAYQLRYPGPSSSHEGCKTCFLSRLSLSVVDWPEGIASDDQ